ncbi:hypothetical protein LTR50_001762 [Elasticomyces elasticus]|nr:hypothetical protein LTR50_001762 [Elasticomyces elasticus]
MTTIIGSAALSPIVTGALLYAITKGPPSIRLPIIERLRIILSPTNVGRAVTALKWLFALGLFKNVNTLLSELAQNSWSLSSPKSDWVWDRELAVVTGASGGFGSLISKGLAAKGVRVVALDVVDLPEDMKSHPSITFHKCDIADPEAVKATAQTIRDTIGDPSILINNAGIANNTPIMSLSPQQLRKIFDINLLSHYYLLQSFLPAMISKKKGHVVAIASMASFVTAPRMSDYSATKAGVLCLHEALGQELKAFHGTSTSQIRLTVVHPTFARTAILAGKEELLERAGLQILAPEVVADAVVKQVLSGRGGQLILAGNLGPWLQEILRGRMFSDELIAAD